MSQTVKGTFASGQSSNAGATSDALVIPSGVTAMRLTLGGTIDASNTVKTQKTTNGGQTWADAATYNSAQSSVSVTVADGEQWRLVLVSQQAIKAMDYTMTVES